MGAIRLSVPLEDIPVFDAVLETLHREMAAAVVTLSDRNPDGSRSADVMLGAQRAWVYTLDTLDSNGNPYTHVNVGAAPIGDNLPLVSLLCQILKSRGFQVIDDDYLEQLEKIADKK